MESTKRSTKRRFSSTELCGVAGCLKPEGKAKTLAQMRRAIGREVQRRRKIGRY